MPSSLFSPTPLGVLNLPNRVALAPMTRCRTTQPGNVPNALMAQYYAQRAEAGFIVSEATQISPQGQGYTATPGIHNQAQITGWRLITDAVHERGGRIFSQLWHVGRMSHASFHGGAAPVAPSAIAPQAQVWVVGDDGVGRMVDCPVPRALETNEIAAIVQDYRRAAANAMAAGFDGVEIHGANGYLIDQFLRSSSNQRSDPYGGSMAKRLRFVTEVMTEIAGEIGAQRVGLRLSPSMTARGMDCPDTLPTMLEVAQVAQNLGLAYIHLAEADWDDAPPMPEDFRRALRQRFQGSMVVAGRYDQARAQAILDTGLADIVAFGRPYIANPDLVQRMAQGWSLAQFDPNTLFGGDARGYSDYPTHSTTNN